MYIYAVSDRCHQMGPITNRSHVISSKLLIVISAMSDITLSAEPPTPVGNGFALDAGKRFQEDVVFGENVMRFQKRSRTPLPLS